VETRAIVKITISRVPARWLKVKVSYAIAHARHPATNATERAMKLFLFCARRPVRVRVESTMKRTAPAPRGTLASMFLIDWIPSATRLPTPPKTAAGRRAWLTVTGPHRRSAE
jgi:hypothetical protein